MNEKSALIRKEQLAKQLADELGIIDLDDRLEFTFDPIGHILVATQPKQPPPTNGNCYVC